MKTNHFTIIGAPFNGIGVPPEEENPAQALRDAGLADILKSRGASVLDIGDIDIPPFDGHRDEPTKVLNLEAFKESSLRLSERMRGIIDRNTTPVVLGGDCGILLGIIGAYIRHGTDIGLAMLDGHADFRDPGSSPSGEAADIPLWVLSGRGPAGLAGLYGQTPMLDDNKIAIFGYREPDMIDQSSIVRFDRDQIAKIGITGSTDSGLRPLLDQGLKLWLHLDVDIIDPLEMPAVHFPEPGGLSIAETLDIGRRIVSTDKVLGLSVACFHNNLDEDGSIGGRLARLISDILT